jgi:hypothetical protein
MHDRSIHLPQYLYTLLTRKRTRDTNNSTHQNLRPSTSSRRSFIRRQRSDFVPQGLMARAAASPPDVKNQEPIIQLGSLRSGFAAGCESRADHETWLPSLRLRRRM